MLGAVSRKRWNCSKRYTRTGGVGWGRRRSRRCKLIKSQRPRISTVYNHYFY